jgi:phage-related tail protein
LSSIKGGPVVHEEAARVRVGQALGWLCVPGNVSHSTLRAGCGGGKSVIDLKGSSIRARPGKAAILVQLRTR